MPALLIRRVDDDLHRLIRVAAASKGLSVTAWVLAALRVEILRQARDPRGAAIAAALDEISRPQGQPRG